MVLNILSISHTFQIYFTYLQHVFRIRNRQLLAGEGPSTGLRDCENRWSVCSSSYYYLNTKVITVPAPQEPQCVDTYYLHTVATAAPLRW